MILERLVGEWVIDTSQGARGVQEAQRQVAALNQSAVAIGGNFREIEHRVTTAGRTIPKSVYDSNRAMTLMHVQALQMNAAMDAGTKTTTRSVAGLGMLQGALATTARQALGLPPVVGGITRALGTMALGSVITTGVLAAAAAIGVAWNKLSADGRELRAEALATQEVLAGAVAGEGLGELPSAVINTTPQVERLREQIRELNAEIRTLEASGLMAQAGIKTRERAGLLDQLVGDQTAESPGLVQGVLSGTNQLGATRNRLPAFGEPATISSLQAAARVPELLKTIALWNQAFQGVPDPRFGVVNKRVLGPEAGLPRAAQFGDVGGFGFGVDRSDRARDEFVKRTKEMADGMAMTTKPLEEMPELFKGMKSSLEGFFDLKQIGSQLAAQGIGFLVGTISDALFGEDYVSVLEENTRALKRLAGNTDELQKAYEEARNISDDFAQQLLDQIAQIEFGGGMDLVRRRFDAEDITDPAEQFRMLQGFLTGQVPGAGMFGIGGLRSSIMQLTPETAGDFLTDILDDIAAGTFDPASLGSVSLTDFLDVLGEMESLGDAAGSASDALNDLAGSINQPSGYKVAFQRFLADEGRDPGIMGGGAGGGSRGGGSRTVNIGDIHIHARREDDGQTLYRRFVGEFERQSQLAGGDPFTLAIDSAG